MLKKLRQMLADTRAKAKAINDLAETNDRALTDVEQKEFDGYVAECTKLQGQIASQEALLELERTTPSTPSTAIQVGVDNATEKPWG